MAAELVTPGTIALVMGSSVLAAVVTQGTGWLREHLGLRTERNFAKLYVTAALESYAAAAVAAISDSEAYEYSDGNAGTHVHNVPEFPSFPDTINWKSLGTELTKLVLAFPNEIEAVRALISFEWDVVGDHELVLPTIREKTARAGSRALQLAARVQDEYQGEPIDLLDEPSDTRTSLANKLEEYAKQRERAVEASGKLFGESPTAQKSEGEL